MLELKMLWRCRCGKRHSVLTDENFGDCYCSDPIYGPEYFYVSEPIADYLDELDQEMQALVSENLLLQQRIERIKAPLTEGTSLVRKSLSESEIIEKLKCCSNCFWHNFTATPDISHPYRDNCLECKRKYASLTTDKWKPFWHKISAPGAVK